MLDFLHNSGILYRRPDGKCLFIHLTFQEYFAAVGISSKADCFSSLKRHLHDPFWRETILLTCGLLHDRGYRYVDEFVSSVVDAGSPFEDILHRDLLLACRILGEDVGADVVLRTSVLDRVRNVLLSHRRAGHTGDAPDTLWPVLGALAGSRSSDFACDALLEYSGQPEWGRSLQNYEEAFLQTLAKFPDCRALRKFIDAAHRRLIEYAAVYSSSSRERIPKEAYSLARFGRGPCRAYVRQIFVGCLDSPKCLVRRAGLIGLGQFVRLDLHDDEFKKLARILRKDKSGEVRTAAIQVLVRNAKGKFRGTIKELLLAATSERRALTRRAAIRGLFRWSSDPDVVARFRELVTSRDWPDRLAAAEGLAKAGDDRELYTLLINSERMSPGVSGFEDAISSIASIGRDRDIRPILPSLVGWLVSRRRNYAEEHTAKVMANLVRESRRKELLEWCRSVAVASRNELKVAAIRALALLGNVHCGCELVSDACKPRLCIAIATCLRAGGCAEEIGKARAALSRKINRGVADGVLGADASKALLQAMVDLGPLAACPETVRLIEAYGDRLTKNKMLVKMGAVAATEDVLKRLEEDCRLKNDGDATETLARLVALKEDAERNQK